MTLILAVVEEPNLLLVSDIVLSGPSSDAEIVGLPIHPAPINAAFPDHAIVSFAQKTIRLSDDWVVQWAGNRIVAEVILREVVARRDEAPTLAEVIAGLGLTQGEIDSVSLMAHRVDADRRHHLDVHNVTANAHGLASIHSAGTGEFHYLLVAAPSPASPHPNAVVAFNNQWLQRIAYAFWSEIVGQESLEQAYGGWFELTRWEGAFRKLPYSIVIWGRRQDGEIGLRAWFACWYVGDHLCVCTITPGPDGPQASTLILTDPMARTPPPAEETVLDTFTADEAQIHLVHDPELGRFGAFNCGPDHCLCRIEAGRATVRPQPSLIAALNEALDNAPGAFDSIYQS